MIFGEKGIIHVPDALAAMLAAGVLASSPSEATTNGCQTIPEDAKVELLRAIQAVCVSYGSSG